MRRLMLITSCLSAWLLFPASAFPAPPSEEDVARRVDAAIARDLDVAGVPVAEPAPDEDFLRRVSFDLTGTAPTPNEVVRFVVNPDPQKREKLVERLLESEDYAETWGRYWRDVVLSRATNDRAARLAGRPFGEWLTARFRENASWDEIATALVTATGDVREDGATGLIFAHDGDAAEIASETSRILLGIQIQCANCHDHPTDRWTRQDFHQLAAYFPRVRVRPVRKENRVRSFEVVSFDVSRRGPGDRRRNARFLFLRFDRNRDGKLTKKEVADSRFGRFFDRLVARIDKDDDGALSRAEFQNLPQPQNRARFQTEHFMPDLADPQSRGERMEPVFFVDGAAAGDGLKDLERRAALARQITDPGNPWFARAYVNRVWAELTGEGFTMPIDDLGPERQTRCPEALAALSEGFTASGYDPQWLFRTITRTETYQRGLRARRTDQVTPPFASATPTRLRADQIFNALVEVLGAEQRLQRFGNRRGRGMMMRYGRFSPRGRFENLFGFDPSKPRDEVTGTVPQALFLMNSDFVNGMIRADGFTRLARILRDEQDDEQVVSELYLLVLSRQPTERETRICLDYVKRVGDRSEAFEDVLWSLVNSSEFVSRR